jgi:hypothetical protein
VPRLRILLAGLTCLVAIGLAGCFGNVNDICQVPSDCNAGLFCCKRGTIDTRGTCQTTAMCPGLLADGGGTDLGTPVDSGRRDAGPLDASADAGSDAAVDLGTDGGALDSGSDAGTDAGADAGVDAGMDAGAVDAGDVDAGDVDAGTAG